MATVGLKGIWGLEQLDRTGIAIWKLGVMLIGASTALAILVRPILRKVNTDSIVFESLPTDLYLVSGSISVALVGVCAFLTVALNRTTEDDMRTLIPLDSSVSTELQRLRPGRPLLVAITGSFALLMPLLIFSASASAANISMGELASRINSAGSAAILFWYGILPSLGIALGPLTITLAIQPLVLTRVASHLNIDLLRLTHYQVIANPLIRFVIAMLLVMSVLPLISLWFNNPIMTTTVFLIGISIVILVGLFVLLYFYPVLILRNRVKKEKEKQLKAVYESLASSSSNSGVPKLSAVAQHKSDLLTLLMFVESRWDWPIASHVTKLVLWGLLVPLTWVMSATIENMLY
jgi:hypothetical protein